MNKQLIVSLTSFPPRIHACVEVVKSLINQTYPPDKVVLNLKEPEFPRREADLPAELLKLRDEGLEIGWWPTNIRSFAKLIPTLVRYPDATIVTADDDFVYEKDWLRDLRRESERYPLTVIAHRAHIVVQNQSGDIAPYNAWMQSIHGNPRCHNVFPTSGGGVLYPPHSFISDILDETKFMSLCPMADDIWFWAMMVLNNTRTRVLSCPFYQNFVDNTQHVSLAKNNVEQGGNDRQLRAVVGAYPAILKKLSRRFRANGVSTSRGFKVFRRNRLWLVWFWKIPVAAMIYDRDYGRQFFFVLPCLFWFRHCADVKE